MINNPIFKFHVPALIENEISKFILTTKKKIDKNKAIEGWSKIKKLLKDFQYELESINLNAHGKYELTLGKNNGNHRLDAGNSVRIIAWEPNIPLLASISYNGSILT